MRPTRRGQTLVLFALGLFLLTLMVMITLALSTKVKEKMELQTLADTVAYSNSVATARTLNSLAVLNRTEISLNVASIGGQSLISWTSMVRAGSGAARANLEWLIANYPASCGRARALGGPRDDIQDDIARIRNAEAALDAAWEPLDRAAGAAVRGVNIAEAMIQGTGSAFGSSPVDGAYAPRNKNHEQLLFGLGGGQRLSDKLILRAVTDLGAFGKGLLASPGTNLVNAREVSREGVDGALCDEWLSCAPSNMNQFEIAMGSRGESFVTGRGVTAPVQAKLDQLLQNAGVQNRVQVAMGAIGGSGYWWRSTAVIHATDVDGADRVGEDHGTVTLTANYNGCSRTTSAVGATALVHSSNMARLDIHEWTGGKDPDSDTVDQRHSLISPIGDGNWPIVTEYNDLKLSQPKDLYGQPKNYALIERDLKLHHDDPWSLKFNFQFSQSGSGRTFDSSSKDRVLGSGRTVDKESALAAGLAYYHRKGDWREGPNLVNPFWRATLVSVDVDADFVPPKDDVEKVLGSAVSGADAVYKQLRLAGYRGVH